MPPEHLESPEGTALPLVTQRTLERLGSATERLSALIAEVLGLVDVQVGGIAIPTSEHPSLQAVASLLNAGAMIECVGHLGLASAALIDEAISALQEAATSRSHPISSADDIHALRSCAFLVARLTDIRHELVTVGGQIARQGRELVGAAKHGALMLNCRSESEALLRRLMRGEKRHRSE